MESLAQRRRLRRLSLNLYLKLTKYIRSMFISLFFDQTGCFTASGWAD